MRKSPLWILLSLHQRQEANPPMNEDSQVFEDSQYQDDGSELELSEDDGVDEDEDEDEANGEMVPTETGEGGRKDWGSKPTTKLGWDWADGGTRGGW